MTPLQARHAMIAALALILAMTAVLAVRTPEATAAAPPTWLCKPGLAGDPCSPGLATTRISPSGTVIGPSQVRAAKPRRLDCFYVYPTVSGQPTPAATKRIDPELRSIALYQAARYSQYCRVYAPVYRQITLAGIGIGASSPVTPAMRETAYRDVRDAWRTYLRRYNRGRGVVLIGHSQGSFTLRRLIAREVDPRPSVRRRLVSALLLGGNVLVRKGSDVGGDFQHIRACRSTGQLQCVVAFSTFGAPPPPNALFGRATRLLEVGPRDLSGLEVLCTNPASLRGGRARLSTIFPSAPFAPGTIIGAATTAVGFRIPPARTPWLQADGAYTARCLSANGGNALVITPRAVAPVLTPLPDAAWGLHLTDANIALGDLVELVRRQGEAYARGVRRAAPSR